VIKAHGTGVIMRMLLSILVMALASSSAHAEWVHSKQEDPFQGDAHLALAIEPDSGYIAGFRCAAGQETDLTFIFGDARANGSVAQ
jgi:hypothetical protein